MSLSSDKVFVFPCVSRESSYDLRAKQLSERNITNIIKSITDRSSYVISWDYDHEYKNDLLKCVLEGYYFEIVESKSDTKYIKLNMTTKGDILQGDKNDTFDGVSITTSKPEEGDYLLVCEGGKVPVDSYCKFEAKALNVDLTSIDCGELTVKDIN